MWNNSRINIYEYIESLLVDNVTENVYLMEEPQELTESDTQDGFVVVRVGDFHDASEFDANAYGWARVFVETYVPPISRGRLDVDKYKSYETNINHLFESAPKTHRNALYWIKSDSVLSMDMMHKNNANNAYFMFVKSFVVMVGGKQKEQE